MNIKLFADGADLAEIKKLKANPQIAGFTTNPTLMRKAGVLDYETFAKDMLQIVEGLPVSFEVFADKPKEMIRQACKIASWGTNVYVKIPVMNTKRVSTSEVISDLANEGVKVNVTALTTIGQVTNVMNVLAYSVPAYISVFAGRVADTGVDPMDFMSRAAEAIRYQLPQTELIWASPREVLNVYQAEQARCHIITATPDILKKLSLRGKDLYEYSLETVKMFYEDAKASGYTL